MTLTEFLSKTINTAPSTWESIKIALYAAFAFLNIDMNVTIIIGILMAIDTLTGIIKSIVLKKVKFTFRSFYSGILTKFVLLLIPMLVSLTALGLGYDFIYVTEAALRLIVLSESISIFTNIISIKQRKQIENKDYLSIILTSIRGWLIHIFDHTIKQPNKDKD